MGVYSRFKKDPNGLRNLVELLETTPQARRKKMIDVGMREDPAYTQLALEYLLTFQDVLELNDLEVAEVISEMPARLAGYAVHAAPQDVKDRFLERAQPQARAEIKEILEQKDVSLSLVGSGQMKMIETTRKLVRKGLIQKKRVPVV